MFVSGAAALLLSRALRAGFPLDGVKVKSLLIRSAKPLTPSGFHPETGYGLLDVPAALRLLGREIQETRDGRRA